VTHFLIPLQSNIGNQVIHPTLKGIRLINGAYLTPARIGNGAYLDGNDDYLTLGRFPDQCMSDLNKCKHGLDVKFYLLPRRVSENSYYMSSGPFSVYYKNGKTYAEFSNEGKQWIVSTDKVST
jgi:hypothetical protein